MPIQCPLLHQTVPIVGITPADIKVLTTCARIPILTKETARKENANLIIKYR